MTGSNIGFKRPPLATVGERPEDPKGRSPEPSGEAAALSGLGRQWRLEGSEAGRLEGGGDSIS